MHSQRKVRLRVSNRSPWWCIPSINSTIPCRLYYIYRWSLLYLYDEFPAEDRLYARWVAHRHDAFPAEVRLYRWSLLYLYDEFPAEDRLYARWVAHRHDAFPAEVRLYRWSLLYLYDEFPAEVRLRPVNRPPSRCIPSGSASNRSRWRCMPSKSSASDDQF